MAITKRRNLFISSPPIQRNHTASKHTFIQKSSIFNLTPTMTPITTALSATSLNNHNPWKPRESELRRLARHWRRFCSDQNTDRQYRGEAPFCNATQRDQAFLKLMRVARGGDEQRDNGRRKCGRWGYEDGDGDVE